jgi:hypothetical protein
MKAAEAGNRARGSSWASCVQTMSREPRNPLVLGDDEWLCIVSSEGTLTEMMLAIAV